MRTTPWFFILAVCCVTLGCRRGDPVSKSIGATVDRGPGTRLALVDHTTFAWERVCVIAPYTTDAQIEAATGIVDARRQAQNIHERDDINLLLFLDDDHVVSSIAHPRNRGDFGPEVVGKCVSKQQAVFIVRTPPAGSWGNIGPS